VENDEESLILDSEQSISTQNSEENLSEEYENEYNEKKRKYSHSTSYQQPIHLHWLNRIRKKEYYLL